MLPMVLQYGVVAFAFKCVSVINVAVFCTNHIPTKRITSIVH
jgi:hypothetical protein